MPATSIIQPLQKGLRVLRDDGPNGLARRVAKVAYDRLNGASLDEQLLPDDIADSRRLDLPLPQVPPSRGRPLIIGWVTTPPGLGSGGHTTMFRMVEALERGGHQCILFLYDRYGGDLRSQTGVIRQGWPSIKAKVRRSQDGLTGVDACVATSWPTAHVLARHGTVPMQRFYFVQDFEPFFYPLGSEYALAEDTYRMGLRCIALGPMVGDLLAKIGSHVDVVSFGCDTDVYRLLDRQGQRSGVVFYTRPGVGRRGYFLGRMALRAFHSRHPEQEIHVYGAPPGNLDFPVIQHNRVSPADLNVLYNKVLCGLAMSFTNVSLVVEEMLASGCIAVANESPYARAVLDNPHIVWADPTPYGLADALSSVVEERASADRAASAAASVTGRSWAVTQQEVVGVIEDRVYHPEQIKTSCGTQPAPLQG